MRVVFWGSPAFAVPTLDHLLSSAHQVVAVVTQPDRPAGRGRPTEPTPVARAARAASLPILSPVRPRSESFVASLGELGADVFLVAAYGQILPPSVLEIPPHGALNVHASLLPVYRGAAPVTRALLDGRKATGVTIMRMEAGLDTGPICLQAEERIRPDDTAGALTARLAILGARLAVEALDRLASNGLPEIAQDHAAASHAPRVTPEEARLDWRQPRAALERSARAFDPWPGAWTDWKGERLKVFRLRLADAPPESAASREPLPGTIIAVDPEPLIQVGDGVLRLDTVQPAGGKRMTGAEWARGRFPAVGDRLGADA